MFGKPPISNPSERPGTEREWRLIEKLLSKSLDEQRVARRWGYAFKLFIMIYLSILLVFPAFQIIKSLFGPPFVAVVDVRGGIMQDADASSDNINRSLNDAFCNEGSRAIILRINSPGGSPVQAGYVYDEIKRLRALYPEKKLYAVIEDLGASAAYYIASAADEIYADKASLVGSIGVRGGGFGFVDAMKKLGVERRMYTAGEHKAFLDPFKPENKEEKAFWESVLKTTHQQFIDQVKAGRGDRLVEDDKLFSGLIWPGETAKALGLIDGFGDAAYVAREVVGFERLVDFSYQQPAFDKFAGKLGSSIGAGLGRAMGLEQPLSLH